MLEGAENADRVRELRGIIKDIRCQEANLYAEIRAICAMCSDYDPKSDAPHRSQQVQAHRANPPPLIRRALLLLRLRARRATFSPRKNRANRERARCRQLRLPPHHPGNNVMPPSTRRTWPLMNFARGPARNATASAISAGSA
jgi:hypothetical protein